MNRKKKSPEERFWRMVDKTETCWLWKGSKDRKGYGRLHRGTDRNSNILAHRFSCELAHGELPSELAVLHRCDNPSCVNPHHLFLGTIADNNHDMTNKGRVASGEANGQSKLTTGDVQQIRTLYRKREYGYSRPAQRFGVAMSTVRSIIKNQTWVEEEES